MMQEGMTKRASGTIVQGGGGLEGAAKIGGGARRALKEGARREAGRGTHAATAPQNRPLTTALAALAAPCQALAAAPDVVAAPACFRSACSAPGMGVGRRSSKRREPAGDAQ